MNGDYSKGVWIAGIIMAVVCIAFDICSLLGLLGDDTDFLKQSAYISIPLCGYVLFKSIKGLKKKLEEEKG